MIYIASGLGWDDPLHDDPAVIDLSLRVSSASPPSVPPLGYWPSYRQISPEARRHYLEWLAGGRSGVPMDVGYVFVFFYGLERRVLVDLRSNTALQGEYPAVRRELVRLLAVYGGLSGSFDGYAKGLLDFADLAYGSPDFSGYHPEDEERQWCCPGRLKYGLSRFVARQQPIPWNWALGWFLCSPQEGCLRTPAVRCRDEFRQLFALRYAEQFSPGLRLKPNRTKLTMSYQSASSALRSFSADCRGLSDVTALSAPLKKIDAVVQACTNELDAYSRYLGRDAGGERSLAALSLLPAELLVGHQGSEFVTFREWTGSLLQERDSAVIRAEDMLAKYSCVVTNGDKISRKDVDRLTGLLEKCGYGMEPDPGFGGARIGPGDAVVLFRSTHGISEAPSADYLVAQVAVHLFWLVASSDGTISRGENGRLTRYLREQSRLSGAEQARLRAYSRWLANARPGASGLKKRIQVLSREQKHQLGQFLVSVVLAEGGVSPDEVKALTRVYDLLELDESQLHGDIHNQATATAPMDPVLVSQGRQPAGGVPIPVPPDEVGVALDLELVERRARETAQVAQLLEGIFSEAEPAIPDEAPPSEECLEGLDAAHSALVRQLTGRQCISREDWNALAGKHSLLPDGALDTVNECALEACDECVCEGDETLIINEQVLKELLQ